jgi:hypothetical protein
VIPRSDPVRLEAYCLETVLFNKVLNTTNPFPSSEVLVARFFEQARYEGGFFIQASLEKQDGSWCSHHGFGVALEIGPVTTKLPKWPTLVDMI